MTIDRLFIAGSLTGIFEYFLVVGQDKQKKEFGVQKFEFCPIAYNVKWLGRDEGYIE